MRGLLHGELCGEGSFAPQIRGPARTRHGFEQKGRAKR